MARGSMGAYEGVTVVAFATAAAMWFTGYLCRLPGASVPSWVVAVLLVAIHAAGGAVAARTSPAGWRAAAATGAAVSLVNLLVLAGVLAGTTAASRGALALVSVPTLLLLGALVAGGAGALTARRQAGSVAVDWPFAFSLVACGATVLLMVVGGLVTSHDAGLAVVDWPNTFGASMFFFPFSRMTGGIYFEHAHRLFGALVGLTALALAWRLGRRGQPRAVRGLAAAVVLAVVGQGVLGGLRVTGRFTLATDPAETAPNLALAAVHGVWGQLVLALLVVLAVLTSPTWRTGRGQRLADEGRWFGPGLVGALVVQLVLGAVLRHFGSGLLLHALVGSAVFGFAVLAGSRGRRLAGAPPPLRSLATAVMVLAGGQVLLGVAAWRTTAVRPIGAAAPVAEVLATTAHQVHGAILLACAVAFAVWLVGSTVRTAPR